MVMHQRNAKRSGFGRAVALLSAVGATCLLRGKSPSALVTTPPVAENGVAGRDGGAGRKSLSMLISLNEVEAFGGLQKIRDVGKKTETKVRLSKFGDWYHFHDTPKKVLTVSGGTEGVLAVLGQLVTPGQEQEDSAFTFVVPRKVCLGLTDAGGKEHAKLRNATAAKVRVYHVPGSDSKVRVIGSLPAVRDVAKALLAEQERIPNVNGPLTFRGMLRNTDQCSIIITVPENQSQFLNGNEGWQLKQLRGEFFAELDFDPNFATPTGDRLLKISGCLGDVHAAHAHIVRRFLIPPDVRGPAVKGTAS